MFTFQPFSLISRSNFSNLVRGTAIKMSTFDPTELRSMHKSTDALDVFSEETPDKIEKKKMHNFR